jgi:hypothetical protein
MIADPTQVVEANIRRVALHFRKDKLDSVHSKNSIIIDIGVKARVPDC